MIHAGDVIRSGRGPRTIATVEHRPDLSKPGCDVFAVLFEDSEPHDAPSLWSNRRDWSLA